MSLSSKEIAELKKLVQRAQELIQKAGKSENTKPSARRTTSTRIRRSGKDLVAFRKTLKAERKAGIPVAKIAEKHGISPAYIYQLG